MDFEGVISKTKFDKIFSFFKKKVSYKMVQSNHSVAYLISRCRSKCSAVLCTPLTRVHPLPLYVKSFGEHPVHKELHH